MYVADTGTVRGWPARKTIFGILDSGATMNFLTPQTLGTDYEKQKHSTTVRLPDGSTTLTTHSKNLLLPELPLAAYKGENRSLPTDPHFNPTIVQEQFKGHVRQRKSDNLLAKWDPRPHWKILPYKKIISSPHWPVSFPQTPDTKVTTISKQRLNLNTR